MKLTDFKVLDGSDNIILIVINICFAPEHCFKPSCIMLMCKLLV